jgi:hypothetical protein
MFEKSYEQEVEVLGMTLENEEDWQSERNKPFYVLFKVKNGAMNWKCLLGIHRN